MKDFRAVANMSADDYRKLLEGAADGVIHAPEIPTQPKYDLIPQGRFPTAAESQQLDRDWDTFVSRYPAMMVNETNAVKIVEFLTSNKATASLRNLETAYSELFPELLFTVVTEVPEQSHARTASDYRDKANRKPTSKGLYISTAAPQSVKRKTETYVVRGRDLTAAEQARLLQPSREREVNRVESLSADDFYSEFLYREDDHLPDIIVARIKRAIGEFLNRNPDYDSRDPQNRQILEMYFDKYKKLHGMELPKDVATSYQAAWDYFKANKVIPVADTDEIVINGRKLGKQNPEIHGVDPTYHLTPELRNRIRRMGSQELIEYLAQNPDVRKAIDEGGL